MKLNYKELRKRLEITQADLVDALGVNQPTISALETGRKDTSTRHIELLRAKYGDIVLQYIEDSTPQNVVYTGNVSGSGNNIVAGNGNNIGTADDDSAVIPEPVIVPASIMQRPELDTKKWVESREAQRNADRLQITEILQNTDMVWRVEDEAMRPTLFQGELVLIHEMDDEAEIVNGKVYAIDTIYHGNVIRRVYDEGDEYRLEPINKDGYTSISIKKRGGFNRRYRILCHLSTEISILPDVEEERRRQDTLIHDVSKAGDRVDRLINLFIENQKK